MMSFTAWLIPTLVVLVQAGMLLSLFHIVFFRKGFFYQAYLENKHLLLWMAFSIALAGTLGSLFYSEVLNYAPCSLCWYQRIFLYPLVVLLGIAAWTKDDKIGKYAIPTAAIGLVIALVHYAEQLLYKVGIVADVINCGLENVSCNYVYLDWYSYVTIPAMSVTAFAAIIIILALAMKK